MDIRRHDIHAMSDDRLRNDTAKLIAQIIEEAGDEIPAELYKGVAEVLIFVMRLTGRLR